LAKPIVTTGVVSMFAGEMFFIHPNLEVEAYSPVVALLLWTCFGVVTAFAGDRIYNRWQATTDTPIIRFGMLWAVIAAIFALAWMLSKMASWIA
jgi:hypothetical protein